jgi:hypothetical protein
VVRLAISPATAAWAAANRFGWLAEPPIGNSPHLGPVAINRWRKAIAETDVYLEYGSGGSTVEAIQSVEHVISVETDGMFLAAVKSKIAETANAVASFYPLHVDIGWTEKWGRPPFPWPSSGRLARWRRYTQAPWLVLEELKLVPNFIFIDGRFRAASVLESFLRLPDNSECLLMLDDFAGRTSHYGGILKFATEVEQADRAIVFQRDPKFDREECAKLLVQLQANPE